MGAGDDGAWQEGAQKIKIAIRGARVQVTG